MDPRIKKIAEEIPPVTASKPRDPPKIAGIEDEGAEVEVDGDVPLEKTVEVAVAAADVDESAVIVVVGTTPTTEELLESTGADVAEAIDDEVDVP